MTTTPDAHTPPTPIIDVYARLDDLLHQYTQITNELVGINGYFKQRLAEVKAERDAAHAAAESRARINDQLITERKELIAENERLRARLAALTLTADEQKTIEKVSLLAADNHRLEPDEVVALLYIIDRLIGGDV